MGIRLLQIWDPMIPILASDGSHLAIEFVAPRRFIVEFPQHDAHDAWWIFPEFFVTVYR